MTPLHRLPGVFRNVDIPESALMPAPVNTAIRAAPFIKAAALLRLCTCAGVDAVGLVLDAHADVDFEAMVVGGGRRGLAVRMICVADRCKLQCVAVVVYGAFYRWLGLIDSLIHV